jgi:hypothetical protein
VKLAVIFPSRGLAFSETVEELLRELTSVQVESRIFFAHSLPIPDCFNTPVSRALAEDFTHFWFVEDDMVLPVGILQELIDADVPAITSDYPVTDDAWCIMADRNGAVMLCGTGCVLMDRATVEKVYPFCTDVMWTRDLMAAEPVWVSQPVSEAMAREAYGLHDVNMSLTLFNAGTPIVVTKSTCSQRVIDRLAKAKQNADGWHVVSVLPNPKERP